MSEPISLYRKFTGTAGLMIISRGLAVISGIIYARYLGPEQYGLYSFVLSIIAMAALPVIAGLPNLLIREIANFHLEKKWGLIKGVISWSFFYVFFSSIIIVSIIFLIEKFELIPLSLSPLLLTALLLIPLKSMLSLQSAIFNGFRRPALAQLPVKIVLPTFKLFVLTIYILFNLDLSASELLIISIYSSFSAFFIVILFFRKHVISYSKKYSSQYLSKKWCVSLLPFTFITLIGTLNSEVASVLLGFISSHESVAYFKVALQGVALIGLGFSSVNAVIMPDIARLYKEGNLKATQDLLTKSVRLSVFVSLPVIFVLTLFGKPLILFLFGSDYLLAYPVLIILCIGRLINVLMGSVGLVLNMTGNEKSVLKVLILTLILNMLLLLIFIPIYGSIGAALAVSVSLIFWNFLMAREVWKLTKLKTWIIFKQGKS